MRKNLGRIIIALIALFTIINPMVVKADTNQMSVKTTSNQTAVGAEVTLLVESTLKVNYTLEFSFDKNVFEFVDAYASIQTFYGPYSDENLGTVSKNVTDGKLTLNYTYGAYSAIDYVVVKFKVKSSPTSGSSNIVATSPGEVYPGKPVYTTTFNIASEKQCPECPVCQECPTCEKDEVSCPVCEECEKCEVAVDTNKETTSSESKGIDSKDILLYSALGACGFLAVVVVILAFRKK